MNAVKGREGTKKRAAAGEKQFVVVSIEQVDMAGPSFQRSWSVSKGWSNYESGR